MLAIAGNSIPRASPARLKRERPYTGILRHGNCEVSGGVFERYGPLFRASIFRAPQSRALPHRPAGLPSSIRERLRSCFPGLEAAYERRGSGLPEYLRDVSGIALGPP